MKKTTKGVRRRLFPTLLPLRIPGMQPLKRYWMRGERRRVDPLILYPTVIANTWIPAQG